MSSQMAHWLINDSAISGSAIQQTAPALNLVGTGDLNGDGRAELLWNQNGIVYSSYFNGSGFDGNQIGAYDSGWLSKLGDINGDGKDDVVWHHPELNMLAWWLMSGNLIVGSGMVSAPPGLSLMGTGDFDGNGSAELLWAGNGAIHTSTFNGTGFFGKYIGAFDPGWIPFSESSR